METNHSAIKLALGLNLPFEGIINTHQLFDLRILLQDYLPPGRMRLVRVAICEVSFRNFLTHLDEVGADRV